MYRERDVRKEDCVALNGYDLPEHTNPIYRAVLQANPLADTPLFDSIPTPPRTIKRSRTQMESFDKLIPHITEAQQVVLDVIKKIGPCTTGQVRDALHTETHLVSGRIAELQQQGYVIEDGAVLNPKTNRHNSLWKAL